MPRPRSDKTPTHYSIPELHSKWYKVNTGMEKIYQEIVSHQAKPHRSNTIMCALNEMQAKLELLNGKK